MDKNRKTHKRLLGFSRFDVVIILLAACIATIAVSGFATAQPQVGQTTMELAKDEVWTFRGSEVVWRYKGGFRVVVAERMNLGFAEQASTATAGTVLFKGLRVGRRLIGRAEITVGECSGAFDYEVRGWVSPAGDKAALTGTPPKIENCRVVGQDPFGPGSTLVFERQQNQD